MFHRSQPVDENGTRQKFEQSRLKNRMEENRILKNNQVRVRFQVRLGQVRSGRKIEPCKTIRLGLERFNIVRSMNRMDENLEKQSGQVKLSQVRLGQVRLNGKRSINWMEENTDRLGQFYENLLNFSVVKRRKRESWKTIRLG